MVETAGHKAVGNVRLPAAMVALVAVLLYAPTLTFDFLNWDDSTYISANPHLGRFDWRFVQWAFTNTDQLHWSPLLWLSFGLDHALWGLNPAGYHLSNVLLYGANVFLTVLLSHRLLVAIGPDGADRRWPAAAAGLLFAVHPLHVEAVAWATSRKDVLSSLFYLGSLLSYAGYVAAAGSRRGRLYALSLLGFLLSLMSKPMAVSLPAVLLILDLYPFRRIRSRSAFLAIGILEKLPFYLAGLVFSLFTFTSWKYFRAEQANRVLHELVLPLGFRIWAAFYAVAYYLGKALLPAGLSGYHPMPEGAAAARATYPIALAAVLLVTAVVLLLLRRAPGLAAAWACYLVMIFPTLGIVNVFGKTMVADRFVYLALLPLILPVAHGAGRLREAAGGWRRVALVGLGLAALLTLAGLTVRQCGFWRDSVAFWSRGVERNPGDYSSMQNLGKAYNQVRAFDKAAFWFAKAVARFPYSADAHFGLGVALAGLGRAEESLRSLDQAVVMQAAVYGMGKVPQDGKTLAEIHRTRFQVLAHLGRHQAAAEDFLRYARLDGSVPRSLLLEGRRRVNEGRFEEAVGIFARHLAAP